MRPIQPETLARPAGPYSPVVVRDDLVGQVAHDAAGSLIDGGIDAQTLRAIENIRTCLEAAGCSLRDVLKVSAFLADLGDFPAFNAVYREHFSEPYPVRTTVGVNLPGGILVELDAIARRAA